MLTEAYKNWVGERDVPNLATNAGAATLAFQKWCHFKESFAPELVAHALRSAEIPVRRCVDPFGGSGTTALTCQFLGIDPITVEVNPFLADLIEAKLCSYDIARLAKDAGRLAEKVTNTKVDPQRALTGGPKTLVEPGENDRWVFDREVAEKIISIRQAIEEVKDDPNRRLFKILLGGNLIALSNVRISGKGRRYRNGWRERRVPPEFVLTRFVDALSIAVHNITLHRNRPSFSYDVRRGDARRIMKNIGSVDAAVFSPPYPNSFDYTDVYNVELWMLGYLRNGQDNVELRNATLTSHVQLKRKYASPPSESDTLNSALDQLSCKTEILWHRDIPKMVGGYFADFMGLLLELRESLREGGKVHMVVGDSQYSGVIIPVAKIIGELAPYYGFKVSETEPFRSMRSSAQQGGTMVLNETLVVLC